ncbi:hypothetical protein J7400_20635 [Shimia sp. R9_2]|uniref:hypothetical protein n=1 Tax=Shimia sp. R9_2 TaxID=2821112 RepID=UPI001ADAD9E9|nr:hypothetical protein [Shimia sp. R9_2]MBO9399089.1 hypothetical protein [Shimia sp. R9_2]
MYRWENGKYQNLPSYKETSTELSKIAKQAARLKESLQNCSHETEWAIEQGVQMDAVRIISKREGAPEHSSMVLSTEHLAENPGLLGVSVTTKSLAVILGRLEEITTKAPDTLPKRSAGKIPDYGLRLWLANIYERWPIWSQSRFSRDVDSTGQPITQAGRFCVHAFQIIEPAYSVSRIMNGMKNLIKEKRN